MVIDGSTTTTTRTINERTELFFFWFGCSLFIRNESLLTDDRSVIDGETHVQCLGLG